MRIHWSRTGNKNLQTLFTIKKIVQGGKAIIRNEKLEEKPKTSRTHLYQILNWIRRVFKRFIVFFWNGGLIGIGVFFLFLPVIHKLQETGRTMYFIHDQNNKKPEYQF